jgi:hypothetical protein
MRFRNLRIAWSVACSMLALLLLLMWARSYWVRDACTHIGRDSVATTVYNVAFNCGTIDFFRVIKPASWLPTSGFTEGWTYFAAKPDPYRKLFFWEMGPRYVVIQFPLVLPAFVVVALAWMPWLRASWRFSLRTLLIATTLVAVVLGLGVWFQ